MPTLEKVRYFVFEHHWLESDLFAKDNVGEKEIGADLEIIRQNLLDYLKEHLINIGEGSSFYPVVNATLYRSALLPKLLKLTADPLYIPKDLLHTVASMNVFWDRTGAVATQSIKGPPPPPPPPTPQVFIKGANDIREHTYEELAANSALTINPSELSGRLGIHQ